MDNHGSKKALDTRELARKVRDEVLGPARCAVVSAEHPLPTVERKSTSLEPRFDLFHFVFSVCSQKARATLAEKGVTYGSNEVTILPPENQNYSPQYVRLRLASEAARKARRVTSFTGISSVATEGFDPLVVPTLVDHETSQVIADSKEICSYLCRAVSSGTDLIPKDIEAQVIEQLDIVDKTPHVALLYGADPNGDRRPKVMQNAMPGIHAHKIAAVERNIPLADGDAELLAAYKQKIVKEKAAASFVVDAQQMRAAIARAQEIILGLDSALEKSGGPWLFGDRFTLADIFWAVTLRRFTWLNYNTLWTTDRRLPRVEAYAARLFDRPSVKNTIIGWPGHPPSDAELAAHPAGAH